MKKVLIRQTKGADTRSADKVVSKEVLLSESHEHIKHVRQAMQSLAEELIEKGEQHDWTKIELIDLFHDNFEKAFTKQIEFKEHEWFKTHVTKERHHTADFLHDDVDLLDLLERLCDGICAGKARTGTYYDVVIPNKVLQKMVANTVTKIANAIQLKESQDD